MTNETKSITAKERDALRETVRLRARVAKADIDRRAALLRAEAERKLSETFDADDERWREAVAIAMAKATAATAEMQAALLRDGVPRENLPSLNVLFNDRGSYALKERRAELRKLAAAKIDLAAKDAKLSVERWQAATQTELLAGLLDTADAKAFLAAMPSAEALLPAMTMQQVDALAAEGGLRLVHDSTGTDD
ncbi:hypothetical protein [Paraburkholderia sp. JPY419]|uniref:hypothetical protein n=1 Tax=Paraburkholderia sp. JPY419 TaxID=667660 RepID=UPI003D19BDEA